MQKSLCFFYCSLKEKLLNVSFFFRLVAFEVLLSEMEDLRILISNEQVLLCTSTAAQVAQYHLR